MIKMEYYDKYIEYKCTYDGPGDSKRVITLFQIIKYKGFGHFKIKRIIEVSDWHYGRKVGNGLILRYKELNWLVTQLHFKRSDRFWSSQKRDLYLQYEPIKREEVLVYQKLKSFQSIVKFTLSQFDDLLKYKKRITKEFINKSPVLSVTDTLKLEKDNEKFKL